MGSYGLNAPSPLAGIELDLVKGFLDREGGHAADGLYIKHGWNHVLDQYDVLVLCSSCDRTWNLSISGGALAGRQQDHLIARVWAPFFVRISKSLCFRFSLAAELAEWLTAAVAECGESGSRYSSLVSEGERLHLCSPHDIDAMLVRLGFEQEWENDIGVPKYPVSYSCAMINGTIINDPIIRLPAGHPLRTWDSPGSDPRKESPCPKLI
jgi:hypothetical protein